MNGSIALHFGEHHTSSYATGVVVRDLIVRRERQIAKGYNAAHDDEHGLRHLLTIADIYRFPLEELAVNDVDRDVLRQALLDQAATLVAAAEIIDREQTSSDTGDAS